MVETGLRPVSFLSGSPYIFSFHIFLFYCKSNSVNLTAAIIQVMKLEQRIKAFTELGATLRRLLEEQSASGNNKLNLVIDTQHIHNPWFTPVNVRKAISSIAEELTGENLKRWTDSYPLLNENTKPLRVGLIMAGNIPLVGFHDFLSVLITGNKLIAKTSSKDTGLIHFISDTLCAINPLFRERIEFTEGALSDFDVVIATGSDNSSRYFDYYFGKYPNIIRRNRNSIAILDGDESESDLENLGNDIFSYFGLGCRNVSKIYCPKGYDLKKMSDLWNSFRDVISHTKYANNYDFSKAVYIVNKESFHDTGYLLLKEDNRISSPVAVLYYEYYESQHAVKQQTENLKEKIQCIIGKHYIPFGKAQSPHLWDYADGIDTIEFLLKKSLAGIL